MHHDTNTLTKGIFGCFSKITEEYLELKNAVEQTCPLLILCKLSDLIVSIEAFSKKYNITLEDLIKFSNKTKSSFLEGKKGSKEETVSKISHSSRDFLVTLTFDFDHYLKGHKNKQNLIDNIFRNAHKYWDNMMEARSPCSYPADLTKKEIEEFLTPLIETGAITFSK